MLYDILIIIFYSLFFWLSRKNIRTGIYLTLLSLPAYQIRYQIMGLPATLLEGLIWLLFLAWLIKLHQEKNLSYNPITWIKNVINHQLLVINNQSLVINKQNLIPRSLRLPIMLLLIAATISVFVSPNLNSALGIWKAYFVEALLFFIIFVYNITEIKHLQQVIRVLGLLTIIIGLFALYQKLTGDFIPNPFWADAATRRITTFFGYPNANALLIAPILMLTIGNFLTDKKIIFKSFSLLVFVLGILTILWTKSAGAVIALAVGLLSIFLINKKARLKAFFIIIIALIIGFSLPSINKTIFNNLNSLSYTKLPLNPTDVQLRYQQWKETIRLLKDTPIFGAGLSGYQTLLVPYHQFPYIEIFMYPHNFSLNFWSETGLLGLISIIWIVGLFFFYGIKNLKLAPNRVEGFKIDSKFEIQNSKLTISVLSAMIVLLVHGLVDVPYFKNDLSILFWVIVGMIIILYQDTRNNQPFGYAQGKQETNK